MNAARAARRIAALSLVLLAAACSRPAGEVERNGHTESIRAAGGGETGMKWLLDKKNCLTLQAGEGFCRD